MHSPGVSHNLVLGFDSFILPLLPPNRLAIMSTMKASDELNEEQVRQLLFDLETSYTAFHNSLTK